MRQVEGDCFPARSDVPKVTKGPTGPTDGVVKPVGRVSRKDCNCNSNDSQRNQMHETK